MSNACTPILIVDDDRVATEALRAMLQHEGYEVSCVENGHDALCVLETGRCRFVITDWVMSEMDGIELCRNIRRAQLPGYVYVILLTAKTEASCVIEGLNAGADDFLTKPFNAAELKLRVRAGMRILSLETRNVAIFAMAKLAESRDPETGAHLERVRHYCSLLAVHMESTPDGVNDIDEDFTRLIYLTSPLHDIGKVGIPDSVLLKPGSLSDAEFAIMKEHTIIGAATLDAAMRQYPGVRFLEMARDIALSHHERYDGNGYPHGLKGEAIPLCARIVALADVYDALTSKRVYKDAFTHELARSIIIGERGKHFDPRVVEAFEATEDQFVAIRQRYADTPLKRAA